MEMIVQEKKRQYHECEHSSDKEPRVCQDGDEEHNKKRKKKKKHKKHKKDKTDIESSGQNSKSPAFHNDKFPSEKKAKKDSSAVSSDEAAPTTSIQYPYQIHDDDHCETPRQAYEDISPLLQAVATAMGKSRATLRIYDPYFCEGSVVANLTSLGFADVYNKLEDFYEKIASNSVPDYDVLVTNPPYSGDNMARLVSFCVRSQKPWFLLLPNYVYMKDYYLRLFPLSGSGAAESGSGTSSSGPFYVAPKQRYQYLTPKGRRQQKSAKVTSPFPTFWYCSGGALLPRRSIPALLDTRVRVDVSLGAPSLLPLVVLPDSDPKKKRLRNAEKRKKHKNRKKNTGAAVDNT